MIEIKHVTKVYGGIRKAVDDISLTIPTREVIGFIDPNGVGKTATTKMITDVLDPDEGEILINGKNIVKELLKTKKESGIVPDNADTFPRLKGLEYLNFMGDIYGVDSERRKQRITSFAEILEVRNTLSDRILSYFHGTRQKVVTTGALLSDPNIWVLDKPMTGLDPQSSYSLKGMMREHTRKENTVFFSTHVLEVAERLYGRIAIIGRGHIVFFGTLEELKQLYLQCDSLEALLMEVIAHV